MIVLSKIVQGMNGSPEPFSVAKDFLLFVGAGLRRGSHTGLAFFIRWLFLIFLIFLILRDFCCDILVEGYLLRSGIVKILGIDKNVSLQLYQGFQFFKGC